MQHTGCAPSLEKGKGPRCATEVDIEGNLKKWARCNKFCTEDPGMKIYHLFYRHSIISYNRFSNTESYQYTG